MENDMMTAIGLFFKKVPAWLWIVFISILICSAVLYFADRNGYNRRKIEDAIRDSSMVAHPETTMVIRYIELPQPKPVKPLQGKPIPDLITIPYPDTCSCEPFMSTYEDSVQILQIQVFPIDKMIFPAIDYKPQKILVPQITQTLVPPSLPFYKTGTAKIICGVIGAGCIYGAIESTGSTRLYLSMAGTLIFVIGIGI
jgi:hypothetical protein